MTSILHPTDFSDSSRQALVQAVRLAAAHAATLHVFHAVLLHADDPAATKAGLTSCMELTEREAKVALRAAGRPDATLDLHAASERGVSVFDAVMDKVAELRPDLLVLGTHGRSGLAKFVMGSEAEKILRHAPCDVMTLRSDARASQPDGRFRRVLVPVDFSEHSRRALAAGRRLAADAASLTLLHVLQPVPEMYYAGGVTSRFQLDADLTGRVHKALQEWAGGIQADLRVAEGGAATEIIRVAEEIGADLIAMGTRGLGGLDHLMVGSVAERVCRFAPLPVLAVK